MSRALFFRWLSGWCWLALLAQMPAAPRKVQVIIRTVEQTLPCPTSTVIRIRADRATVRVQDWNQPTLRVTPHLSARYPNRAMAEKGLISA